MLYIVKRGGGGSHFKSCLNFENRWVEYNIYIEYLKRVPLYSVFPLAALVGGLGQLPVFIAVICAFCLVTEKFVLRRPAAWLKRNLNAKHFKIVWLRTLKTKCNCEPFRAAPVIMAQRMENVEGAGLVVCHWSVTQKYEGLLKAIWKQQSESASSSQLPAPRSHRPSPISRLAVLKNRKSWRCYGNYGAARGCSASNGWVGYHHSPKT